MTKDKIKLKCACGHIFDVDMADIEPAWEIVDADEREMGTESLHEAEVIVECPTCGSEITLTMHVWEYPEGIANMQEILAEGAEVVDECDLSSIVEFENLEYHTNCL